MKTAIITGIDGQDGSYLAEFLLAKGYRVVGAMQYPDLEAPRIAHIQERVQIVKSDLQDTSLLEGMVQAFRPDEFYNLAARASGSELWVDPVNMGDVNGLAVTRILEAIVKHSPATRFIQACSSEIYGNAAEVPQAETTPFRPRNPYGAAKVYGYWITANYREARNLFACSSILFNHESPRRGLEFVTRKISRAIAEIKLGLASELRLGNLDARRDWGFAGDYVQAMWLMLQHPVAEDFVVATGETHSVREFCEAAFSYVGLDYQDHVVHDPEKLRSAEGAQLVGNAGKARRLLGWQPRIGFQELVRMMVDADLKAVSAVASQH